MREVKVQPLSRDAFAKYGTYQNLLDDGDMAVHSINKKGFFCDLLQLDFGTTTLPSVNCCQVQKPAERIIGFVECHKYTCEGLLPIDSDMVIYVGLYQRGEFNLDSMEAFLIPKGTFVKLNPLIVHGTQYPVNEGISHCLCLLPMRTFANDTIAKRLDEADRLRVID